MLINGKFVREDPPKIGRFYVQKRIVDTPEERFAQSVMLGWTNEKQSLLSKIFNFMMRI